jgi:hypothetical protein
VKVSGDFVPPWKPEVRDAVAAVDPTNERELKRDRYEEKNDNPMREKRTMN